MLIQSDLGQSWVNTIYSKELSFTSFLEATNCKLITESKIKQIELKFNEENILKVSNKTVCLHFDAANVLFKK